MPDYDWQSWLHEWNRELLERFDPTIFNRPVPDMFRSPDVTPEIIASGWLGYPPATEEQIGTLEQRIGIQLPPSYRQFLKISNGFRQPGVLVPRLFSIPDVEWYHVRNQDVIDDWHDVVQSTINDIFEEQPNDDEIAEEGLWEWFLPYTLEISAQETNGTACYLLNANRVNEDGEWQAFLFAHWIPGVAAYPSFWELMQSQHKSFLNYSNRLILP
jgi:hypothetical protein